MSNDATETTGLQRWPAPESEDGQTEVMLLGVYHMANPGHDEYNLEVDDVLTDRRQQELQTVVEQLSTWEPDHVAVECHQKFQSTIDTAYEGS